MHNQRKSRKYLENGGDILVLIISFLVCSFLAKRHAGIAGGSFRPGVNEIFFLLFLVLVWNFGSRIFGLYDVFRFKSLTTELIALGKNILLQLFSVVAILFMYKSQILSRFFVFTYCIMLLALLLLRKLLLNLLFGWLQKNSSNLNHILIIGGGEVARRFFATIAASAHLGFEVKGFIADQPMPDFRCPCLGTIAQLPKILEREKIDNVVIALSNKDLDKIGEIIAVCENFPTRVRIIPDYFEFMSPRFGISRFGAFPLLSIRVNPLDEWHWQFLKRTFDLLVTSLLFLGVFSWLWPLLALLIKITSPGPVFFKQERWGIKNMRIVCYKFRSMVKESKDVDENGHYQQATRDDPRITRLGRFLRRSNLDELPQFLNVLKGEMSLVGPRPHPTPMNLEIKDSIQHYQLRHLIKPGITGWAQVNGFRGETRAPDLLRKRVESDIWYIENWSILLDVKIVCLTIWLMLNGDSKAY